MNFPKKAPRPKCGSRYGKLASMAVCSLVMITMIGKQLPAHAADMSATVSLTDLDLRSEKGMQAARERLQKAARKLCDRAVDPWSMSGHTDYLQCVDDTTSAALAQLTGPLPALAANAKPQVSGHTTP